jgi:peptidoglycan/LPS O-acetylase OafA/YrhL
VAKRPDLYARLSVPGAAATHHARWVGVDALRAIAALMVLASHAPFLGAQDPVGPAKLASRLGVGVWIFFAASGYLIAGPFLRALLEGRRAPSAGRYAIRRAVRIFPAYWVALAALLLIGGASLAHGWQLPVHALLVHGLVPGELKSVFLVAWSLGVELIFYALVPLGVGLWLRLARGRPVPLRRLVQSVLALWATAVAISVVLAVAFPFRAAQGLPGAVQVLDLVGSLANFCPGMLVFLAVVAVGSETSPWTRRYVAAASRPVPMLATAALLFLVATQLPFQTSHVATAAQGPLFGIASGLVLATFVHAQWTGGVIRVLAPAGLVSYGVYLWHWVILTGLVHYGVTVLDGGGLVPTIGRIALLCAATLPVAAVSWLLLERPLLRRTSGWERSRAAASARRRRADEPSDGRSYPAAAPAPLPAPPRP